MNPHGATSQKKAFFSIEPICIVAQNAKALVEARAKYKKENQPLSCVKPNKKGALGERR
jgi:hypothetical protein